jgi:hypothetical protein
MAPGLLQEPRASDVVVVVVIRVEDWAVVVDGQEWGVNSEAALQAAPQRAALGFEGEF